MRSLKQMYLELDLQFLRAISDLAGIELNASIGRAAALELAHAMQDPTVVERIVAELTEDALQALDALLAAGGQMPVATFERSFGKMRPLGSGARERERPHLYPAYPTEALWYRGIIGRAFRDEGSGPREFFFVPDELMLLLPNRASGSSRRIQIPSISPANNVIELANSMLVDDACTVLAYLRVFPMFPPKAGTSSYTEYSDIHPYLRHPSALSMLLKLLQELEFLTGDPLRVNAAKARPFLQATRGKQLRSLAVAWNMSVGWRDVLHVPGLRFDEPDSLRTDSLKARHAILDHLDQIVPGQWTEMRAFVSYVKEHTPEFQRLAGDYDSWYVFDSSTGQHLRGFDNWDRVDGESIEFLVRGPMHWLGIVDMCLEPVAFRLTPVFNAMRSGGDWEIQEKLQPIKVKSDGVLQAGRATNRADRFLAARLGEWRVSPDDDTYLYQMTATSLMRAAESGIAAKQVLSFLQRASHGPVPPHLQRAVMRLDQDGVEVSLHDLLVLRVRSETLMTQIMEHTSTRRLLGDTLGPKAVQVRSRDWNDVRTAMLDLGIFLERE